MTKSAGITTATKLIYQYGCYKDSIGSDKQLMESFDNWIYRCISITVCYNQNKCISNKLVFLHVEDGKPSEV